MNRSVMVHNRTTRIETTRLILRQPPPSEAADVVQYLLRNRAHLANSGPEYPPGYFTVPFWQEQLTRNNNDASDDKSYRMFVYEKQKNKDGNVEAIVGTVNLNELVRRAAQFCYLGYGLDESKQGQGFMSEAVKAAIAFGFEELNLHRIMANYIPTNVKSGQLLKRLGFTIEGVARDYLYINGKWQDHVLTSIINANWRPERA